MNKIASTGAVPNFNDLSALQSIKTEKNPDEALRKVAQQFESIFINIMLKSMRQANEVFEDSNMSGGEEGGMYRDMYDQQLALTMSHGKGIGIADALYAQMKDRYSDRRSDTPPGDATTLAPPGPRIATPQTSPQPSPKSDDIERRDAVDGPNMADSPRAFMDSVLPVVKKAAASIGINPLIMVAQAALETGWGKFVVKDAAGNSSNNLFNIKADSRWQGEKVEVSTREYREGRPVMEQAAFRRYDSVSRSAEDFADFIRDNPRYRGALDAVADGKEFIRQLQQAGYATDPAYAKKVLAVFDSLNKLMDRSGDSGL